MVMVHNFFKVNNEEGNANKLNRCTLYDSICLLHLAVGATQNWGQFEDDYIYMTLI